VSGRHEQVHQVILQLLLNAADAAGGDPSRSSWRPPGDLSPVKSGDRRVLLCVRQDGARVLVTVDDSGPGIPEAIRPRIFDAFFTTKPDATGIGLALSRQIVAAHGGELALMPASELGGALFQAILPAASGVEAPVRVRPRSPQKANDAPRAASPHGAHLLWIDDDALFLRSIRRAIKGFDVLTARSAAEAEELLESGILPQRIFCDVGLPDRGGHELHAAIKATRPELADRFVFVTGGAITSDVADYLVASRCPTMLKPVRIEEAEALLKGPGSSDPPAAGASAPPGAHSSRGRRRKGA
jgi:two-component system, cell cycle sensor histidine kinase and response regulator CckA